VTPPLILGLVLALASLLPTTQSEANTRITHEAKVPHGKVELMTEEEAFTPGHPLTVGVMLSLEKDWHTYWSNPGDSGATPRFTLSAPRGFEVGPVDWPLPKRIVTGPLTTFGHEGENLFMFKFTPPGGLRIGQRVAIELKGEFLICKDICVPGPFELTKELQVVEASSVKRSGDAGSFDRTRAMLPAQAPSFEISERTARVALPSGFRVRDVSDFFPYKESGIEAGSKVRAQIQSGRIELILPEEYKAGQKSLGVLSLTGDRNGKRAELALMLGETAARGTQLVPRAAMGWDNLREIVSAVLAAFFGGLLLNLMPCVFPVVSIKLFGLLKHGVERAREIRRENLAYSAGVVVAFLLIAGLLVSLRAAGAAVGWGFQLQSPLVLSALSLLFVALAFNFLGFFEIPGIGANLGANLAAREGTVGAFFSGALCVVVASPCTAPFMGASVGFAVTQPLPVLIAIFFSLGVGLASPYLLVAIAPNMVKMLPRPGAWMERFKEFLAFPMIATALWLMWLLATTRGADAVILLLSGCLMLGVSVWAMRFKSLAWRTLAALALVSALLLTFKSARTETLLQQTSKASADGLDWKPFSRASLEKLRSSDRPVFVDFTADWCLTCKVNEKVTFSARSTRALINEFKLELVKADWTERNPEITAMLEEYGRIGVPFYVLFVPGETGPGRVLPEVLTPAIFERELRLAFEAKTKEGN
jgi:thiol:disulfide interchange protein